MNLWFLLMIVGVTGSSVVDGTGFIILIIYWFNQIIKMFLADNFPAVSMPTSVYQTMLQQGLMNKRTMFHFSKRGELFFI